MGSIDERIERAIAQVVKDGQHSNKEISDLYDVPLNSVNHIQHKHNIVKNSPTKESHIEAQKASLDKIKEEALMMQKRELDAMNPKQLLELYKRNEKQHELKNDFQKIKNIAMNMLHSRFPNQQIIDEITREDIVMLKTCSDIVSNYHDKMIGNGDPLIDREVEDVRRFGVPLPIKEYFGDGEIIEVEN